MLHVLKPKVDKRVVYTCSEANYGEVGQAGYKCEATSFGHTLQRKADWSVIAFLNIAFNQAKNLVIKWHGKKNSENELGINFFIQIECKQVSFCTFSHSIHD